MAVTATITVDNSHKLGPENDLAMVVGKFSLAGTYAAGGFAFDLSRYFRATPYLVNIEPRGGMSFQYDFNATVASAKVIIYAHTHNLKSAGKDSGTTTLATRSNKLYQSTGATVTAVTGAVINCAGGGTGTALLATQFIAGQTPDVAVASEARFVAIGRIK